MAAGSRRQVLLLLLLCLCSGSTVPAASERLLMLPFPAASHVRAMIALSTELEARSSWEVHVALPDTLLGPASALATALYPAHKHTWHTYPSDEHADKALTDAISSSGTLGGVLLALRHVTRLARDLAANEATLQQLRGLGVDLVVQDAAWMQVMGCLLGVLAVDFDVGTGGVLMHPDLYGCQFPAAYLPAPGTPFPSTGMTLAQRGGNLVAAGAAKALTAALGRWGPLAGYRSGLGLSGGDLARCKPLLLLVNYDFALEPPRPISPMVRYTGPLLPRPPAPLPTSLAAWLEGTHPAAGAPPGQGGAKEGLPGPLPVVLISFGSSLTPPATALTTVGRAVAACLRLAAMDVPGTTTSSSSSRQQQQRRGPAIRFLVLLRPSEQAAFDAGLLAGHSPPPSFPPHLLHRVEALPQNDVLGHPSLAAFVTQGGYLSMAEAAYHGVPVVGVPLIIGQGDIVSAAVDQGRALLVSKSSLLRGDPGPLVAALQAVVSNSSYKAAAGVIARRLAAAPPPGEVAAQQVAYALQIRDQPPFLQTQGAGMPLYQVLMLDVVGVGVAGCVAVVAAGRWLWRRLWGGSTRLGGVVAKVKSA